MSFAQGFNQGLQMVANYQKISDGRKAREKQDQQDALMAEANKAGQEAFKSFMTPVEAERSGMQADMAAPISLGLSGAVNPADAMNGPAPTLGQDRARAPGGLSLGGMSLASGGMSQKPAQQPKAPDEREGILAAAKARRMHLMKAGVDPKVWANDWAQESALRNELRTEKFGVARNKYLASGDPMDFINTVYPLIEDNKKVLAAKPLPKEKGDGWSLTIQDDLSGESRDVEMPRDRFEKLMLSVGSADPKDIYKVETESLIARLKAEQEIRKDQSAARDKMSLQDAELSNDLRRIEANKGSGLAQISARGREERLTNAVAPKTLGTGDMLVRGDGKGGYTVAAKGGDKKPEDKGFTLGDVRYIDNGDGTATEMTLKGKPTVKPTVSNW